MRILNNHFLLSHILNHLNVAILHPSCVHIYQIGLDTGSEINTPTSNITQSFSQMSDKAEI